MISLLGISIFVVVVIGMILLIKTSLQPKKEGFEMDKMSTAVVSIFGVFIGLGAIFAIVLLVANMKSA